MTAWEAKKAEYERRLSAKESRKRPAEQSADSTSQLIPNDSFNASSVATENSFDDSPAGEMKQSMDQLNKIVQNLISTLFQPPTHPTNWMDFFQNPLYIDTVYLFGNYFNHDVNVVRNALFPRWGYMQGNFMSNSRPIS